MRAVLVSVCLVMMGAVHAEAQGAPTAYVLAIYQAGSSTPTSSATVAKSAMTCGQPKATGVSTNPTKWRIDDPANAALDCVYDDTVRLQALADGSYEASAKASNADGTSAETARVPFVRRRPNPPGVPTGVRLSD
jgi:hypothetical protein